MDRNTFRKKIEEAEWVAPELLDSRVAELLSYTQVELSSRFFELLGDTLIENNGKLTTQDIYGILRMVTEEPIEVEITPDGGRIVSTNGKYYV